MKLYYFPLSTYSQKTIIALYEKGVEFTAEVVNLGTAEGRAEYEKIYPLGKVPLLIADDGRFVPESSIIIEYIDARSDKGPRLIPEDKDLARQTRFYDRIFDCYVNEPFQTIFFDARRPEADKNPTSVARARQRLDTTYKMLDKHLEKNEWALGKAFTMADCAAAPALAGARMVQPFDAHKNLSAYFGRLVERPSFARVVSEAKPYLAKFMS